MNEQEDYIIQNPYHPTDAESLAISELTSKGLEQEDWSSQKVGITSFKDNLREHMWNEQNFRCAYCRIEIPMSSCFLQREHIVPKKIHPKWIFEPRNLCFACDRKTVLCLKKLLVFGSVNLGCSLYFYSDAS